MGSEANWVADAESPAETTPPRRLVIRVVLPRGSLQAPLQRRFNRAPLLLIAAVIAALLGWIGVRMFAADPTAAPAAAAPASNSAAPPSPTIPARTEAGPAVSAATLPKPAAERAEPTSSQVETRSSETTSAKPGMRAQPDAPPAPVDEVLPDVPQSALDTIRGTVRVITRVIIDKDGAVIAAAADDPGPSRYFERLSLEASKKWTFTPEAAEEQRVMLVRFHYRRDGVTARADLPQ